MGRLTVGLKRSDTSNKWFAFWSWSVGWNCTIDILNNKVCMKAHTENYIFKVRNCEVRINKGACRAGNHVKKCAKIFWNQVDFILVDGSEYVATEVYYLNLVLPLIFHAHELNCLDCMQCNRVFLKVNFRQFRGWFTSCKFECI